MAIKTRNTPEQLSESVEGLYPGGGAYVRDAQTLVKYYDDDAVDLTRQLLDLNDRTPVTSNIMKRVVDTLSVTYDQPPARRLITADMILPDSDDLVLLMEAILKASGYDAHFKRIDSLRTLLGTVARRTYAVDIHSRLAYRTYLPYDVYRLPTAGFEDDITQDEAVALKLMDDRFELWERNADGWVMFITKANGEVVSEPFGPDGISPYDVLPIQLINDQPSEGRAFMPLKKSRISFQETINRMLNAVPEMIDYQAYDQMVAKVADPSLLTNLETGPKTLSVMAPEDDLIAVQRSPAITESGDAIDRFIEKWLISENIPIDYFRGSSNLQTGAALRAQLWPLKERRDQLQPLVISEQTQAFEIIRSIWNVHAADWGMSELPMSIDINIQVTDIPIPIDEDTLRDIGFREIAAGLNSTIMYLQRKHQIGRIAAIDMFEQIQVDNSQYEPAQSTNALVDGPPEALGDGSASLDEDAFDPDIEL